MTQVLSENEKKLAFCGVLMALFLFALNQTIIAAALPRIVSDLRGFELYPWAFTSFSLASTVSIPVWGSLSDHRGRRPIFLFGVFLFGLATFATGWADSMPGLIFFRTIQGLGGGALMSMAFATIADIFTSLERAKYQGFNSTVFAISSFLGPSIGGYLTDQFGWRYIFWVTAPLSLVAFYFLYRYLPSRIHRGEGKLDRVGISLLIFSLVPLLCALSLLSGKNASPTPAVLILVCSAFVALIFFWWEFRVESPVIDPRFLLNPTLRTANLASFLTSAGFFGAIIYLPLFMQGVRGASATSSGMILTPLIIGMTVTSTLAGLRVSRTGHYKSFILMGISLMTISLGILSLDLHNFPAAGIVVVAVLLGLGIGPTNSLFVLAVQTEAPRNRIGTVTSTNQFFRQMGGTVGVALFGSVLAASFQDGLYGDLPGELTSLSKVTVSRLTSPEVITDPRELSWAQSTLENLGVGEVTEGLVTTLREHLTTGIRRVFLSAAILSTIALVLASVLPNRNLKSPPCLPRPEIEAIR